MLTSSRIVARHAARVVSARSLATSGAIFPNECDGNNYDLNWSLNADGVSPAGNAYTNAQVSGGKDGSKCDIELADDFTYKAITAQLSASDALFVYDGAVGTTRDDQIGVRLITDCEFVASKSSELLLKVPKKNPLEADRPIVVYACCDGDGFCATECDEDVGAVFSAGASVDTIKQAVAAVAGEILETDVSYQKPTGPFDILKA